MQQQHERTGEIEQFLQSLHGEENRDQEKEKPQGEIPQPNTKPGAEEGVLETIHVYFVREEEAAQNDGRVRESTPPGNPQRKSDLPAYAIILFFIFLIFSCIALQLSLVFNPPTATITLVPRSQTVTLSATVQLGRLLNPLTLRQSQTVPTTGKGHQDAKQAHGTITFYNGLFSPQTVSAGTIVTSVQGVRIATEQEATIPAANPPNLGQATVQAHVVQTGTQGNIAGYAVDTPCCFTAVKAINTQAFYGGQNERNYTVVAQGDITGVAATLKPTLTQSMHGALHGQLLVHEHIQTLPCTPTVSADHQPGEEANEVKVTVSETCRAIAYNNQELVSRATDLLMRRTEPGVETSDSLLRDVHMSVTRASLTHTPHPPVFLSFHVQGTWIYALSQRTQQQIKTLIAGKTKQAALHLLLSLPGIKQASISWGDDTKLPKDTGYMHITLIVPS